MPHSSDNHTDFFKIITGVFLGNTLSQYMLNVCKYYAVQTSIYVLQNNGFTLKNTIRRRYPIEKTTLTTCCDIQIRPFEEQLKQRVIGKRYCISRKRKSYKGSTSRARLAVRLSNVS